MQHQWDTQSFFVEMWAFQVEAMVSQHFTMIRHEDQQRVFQLAGGFQCFDDAPQLIVDEGDHRVVGRGNLTPIIIGHGFQIEIPRFVMSPSMVEFLIGGLVVPLAFLDFGQGHIGGVVPFHVIRRRIERVMWIKTVETEKPWLFLMVLYELDGLFGAPGRLVKLSRDAIFDIRSPRPLIKRIPGLPL